MTRIVLPRAMGAGLLPFSAVAALVLAWVPATAQVHSSTPTFNQPGGALGTNENSQSKPAEPPPPALPGAHAPAAAAAPAARLPTDMSPNDALFDAINRGDIATARDAISRGADLSARNILGMTPLELSVDLGRNDISFLLLSLRGTDDDVSHHPAATAATPAAGAKAGSDARSARHTRTAKGSPAPGTVATATPHTPRLFAGDGGTPIPAAGFLGFDAARAQP